MSESNPRETIFSIARENKALRWAVIILAGGIFVCAMTIFMINHKPQVIWVVTENGKITNSDGLFFEWEARESARIAIKSFYQFSPSRERYLKEYFDSSFIALKQSYKPSDRLVGFEVGKVEYKEGGVIVVSGDFMRGNADPYTLLVFMKKVARTGLNPFGLIVYDAKKDDKKNAVAEDALMSVSVSSETAAVSVSPEKK